ncbi:MAG: hypothetical protein AAFP88_02435 [Bacteroidota bacterium]
MEGYSFKPSSVRVYYRKQITRLLKVCVWSFEWTNYVHVDVREPLGRKWERLNGFASMLAYLTLLTSETLATPLLQV